MIVCLARPAWATDFFGDAKADALRAEITSAAKLAVLEPRIKGLEEKQRQRA